MEKENLWTLPQIPWGTKSPPAKIHSRASSICHCSDSIDIPIINSVVGFPSLKFSLTVGDLQCCDHFCRATKWFRYTYQCYFKMPCCTKKHRAGKAGEAVILFLCFEDFLWQGSPPWFLISCTSNLNHFRVIVFHLRKV